MLVTHSRRQRQQQSVDGEPMPMPYEVDELVELAELLELVDEVLEARCCCCCCCWRGSGAGRWAAWVCSCRRREASDGLDMDSGGGSRKASSGWVGSEGVWGWYSEMGLWLGVSSEKWV